MTETYTITFTVKRDVCEPNALYGFQSVMLMELLQRNYGNCRVRTLNNLSAYFDAHHVPHAVAMLLSPPCHHVSAINLSEGSAVGRCLPTGCHVPSMVRQLPLRHIGLRTRHMALGALIKPNPRERH